MTLTLGATVRVCELEVLKLSVELGVALEVGVGDGDTVGVGEGLNDVVLLGLMLTVDDSEVLSEIVLLRLGESEGVELELDVGETVEYALDVGDGVGLTLPVGVGEGLKDAVLVALADGRLDRDA